MENLISYYLQVLFMSLILFNHLIEIYLHQRQYQLLKNSFDQVPQFFNDQIPLEAHQKSILYSQHKLIFNQLKLVWEASLLFFWLPFHGAEKLYSFIPFSSLHKEVFFIIAFLGANALINLPWKIYDTFFLEEKFHFNKTTPLLFVKDLFKGSVLTLIFVIPVLYSLFFLFQKSSHWWWFWGFILVSLFQFFLILIYPSFIAPLFNKFSPLSDESLKLKISYLLERVKFKAKEIYIMDASQRSSHGNAYFTGLGRNKRIIFFDTLIKNLNEGEILAILAHELGHMKLKHILKSFLLSLVFSFLGFWLMGTLATKKWFFLGHFFKQSSPSILLLLFMITLPVYLFWSGPINSWFSRKNEFAADKFAAQETNAKDLISGLLKLYDQNASTIVHDKLYSLFYHSHPPAEERIHHLTKLKTSK